MVMGSQPRREEREAHPRPGGQDPSSCVGRGLRLRTAQGVTVTWARKGVGDVRAGFWKQEASRVWT